MVSKEYAIYILTNAHNRRQHRSGVHSLDPVHPEASSRVILPQQPNAARDCHPGLRLSGEGIYRQKYYRAGWWELGNCRTTQTMQEHVK